MNSLLMLSKPYKEAVKIFAVAMVLACAPANSAQTAPPSGESAVKLDKTIQDLKNEALQFNREATTLERDVSYPVHTRVALYLGVRINALLLSQISVSFDDGAPQKFTYDDKNARALYQASNIDRLLNVNLKPGSHRIHADFVAHYDGAKADAQPITGSYDALFDKTYSESELELVMVRGKSSSKPILTLKEWKRVK